MHVLFLDHIANYTHLRNQQGGQGVQGPAWRMQMVWEVLCAACSLGNNLGQPGMW
jgi:hypothetical protein